MHERAGQHTFTDYSLQFRKPERGSDIRDGVAPRGVVVQFPKRVDAQESKHSPRWLEQEVQKAKLQPDIPGQTPWYEMKGTGFWVGAQAKQLLRNLPSSPVLFPDALELELGKVATDIRHFEKEYLQQYASLEWKLDWEVRDGKKRIVCSDYVGADKKAKLWEGVTSKDEREGVVYDTLFGNKEKGIVGVEEKLQHAPDGTIAVMVSPAGWSGYDGITYPEAQVYAIQKLPGDKLRAHTFRYDATIEQNEALQRSFGLQILPATDPKERVKNVVANVVISNPEKGESITSMEDVVSRMQDAVGGRQVAYSQGGDIRTFADIQTYLSNPEKYAGRHSETENIIVQLQRHMRKRLRTLSTPEEREKDTKIALALTPIWLNRMYRQQEEQSERVLLPNNVVPLRSKNVPFFGRAIDYYREVADVQILGRAIDYYGEVADLRSRSGCAGGRSNTQVDSTGTRRDAYVGGSSEGFTCPKCHYAAASIGGDTCPGCGITKQEFAAESGIACD